MSVPLFLTWLLINSNAIIAHPNIKEEIKAVHFNIPKDIKQIHNTAENMPSYDSYIIPTHYLISVIKDQILKQRESIVSFRKESPCKRKKKRFCRVRSFRHRDIYIRSFKSRLWHSFARRFLSGSSPGLDKSHRSQIADSTKYNDLKNHG